MAFQSIFVEQLVISSLGYKSSLNSPHSPLSVSVQAVSIRLQFKYCYCPIPIPPSVSSVTYHSPSSGTQQRWGKKSILYCVRPKSFSTCWLTVLEWLRQGTGYEGNKGEGWLAFLLVVEKRFREVLSLRHWQCWEWIDTLFSPLMFCCLSGGAERMDWKIARNSDILQL